MYKQAQDVSTIAKDGPLKSRRTQHGHPGAHQRSVSLYTAKKACVFDGYPWTWPRHCVDTRGRVFEWWEAERKKMAAGRGPTRELGHSPEGLCLQIMCFSLIPQSCFVLALTNLYLERSTDPLFPPSGHFRSFLQSALCAILQALFLNQQLPQLGAVGVFPFWAWWFQS